MAEKIASPSKIDTVGYVIVYSGESGIERFFVGFTGQSRARGTTRLNSARIYTGAEKTKENPMVGYKPTVEKLTSLGWSVMVRKISLSTV